MDLTLAIITLGKLKESEAEFIAPIKTLFNNLKALILLFFSMKHTVNVLKFLKLYSIHFFCLNFAFYTVVSLNA